MSVNKSISKPIIFFTILFSILYVILRYHIFGSVPWKDFSMYVLNKGLSLSAIILLTFNFAIGPLKNMGIRISQSVLDARISMGISGFLLILTHVFISLLIFNSNYYKGFFLEDGTLTMNGSLSLLGGILAFIILWIYNISFKTFLRENTQFIEFITSRKFLMYSFLLSGIHLFFMGYTGWMIPSKWNGGMPPVSLISFIFFALGFIINFFGRK